MELTPTCEGRENVPIGLLQTRIPNLMPPHRGEKLRPKSRGGFIGSGGALRNPRPDLGTAVYGLNGAIREELSPDGFDLSGKKRCESEEKRTSLFIGKICTPRT